MNEAKYIKSILDSLNKHPPTAHEIIESDFESRDHVWLCVGALEAFMLLKKYISLEEVISHAKLDSCSYANFILNSAKKWMEEYGKDTPIIAHME